MKLKQVILGALVILLAACSSEEKNVKNIQVKACVVDSATQKPIANARIVVLCWYHAKWDKADYLNIDTVTDSNGCFSGSFEKGYKIVAGGVSANYGPNLSEANASDKGVVQLKIQLQANQNPIIPADKLNLRDYIVQNSSN